MMKKRKNRFPFGTLLYLLLSCCVFSNRSVAQVSGKDSLSVTAWPLLIKASAHTQMQVVAVDIQHNASIPAKVEMDCGGKFIRDSVHQGKNHFEFQVPAVKGPQKIIIKINIRGALSETRTITLQPVHPRTLYFISHSHNDIGYSDLQTVVEAQQNAYTREAMQLIQKTKSYPKNARYKWNIESLWALENFFRIASDSERQTLIRDVKSGYIGLSAGYCNELTGLCRPQELYHLLDYSRILQKQYGVSSKTYMISDVPGMNWSVVPEFAQRGVRYISSGPNYSDRVGYAREAWDNKPFYWVSPSGKDTVLYWQAGKGYSFFHNWIAGPVGANTKHFLADYMRELDAADYPYDMVQMRYTIVGDNHGPDPHLPDFVKQWNEKYANPKLVIATVDAMMEKFEKRYGRELPVHRGDFTPYWEDGAMSTAKEETLAKHSVERLIQAEVLDSLLTPAKDNSNLFYKAWRDVIMWHEHTWGAWCSISKPDSSFTISQWKYKQRFALKADSLSRNILSQWIRRDKVSADHAYNVYNTSGWVRSGMVRLSKAQSSNGDGIMDGQHHSCPTQRLSNGDLIFLAKDVPALGSKKFYNIPKKQAFSSGLKVNDHSLENRFVKVVINSATGSIQHFIDKKNGKDLADHSKQEGLNEYLYVSGRDPSKAEKTSDVKIRIKENGPLLASLEISSVAPGTNSLHQEIRLINGMNKVDIINTIDKIKVRTKESVHFAYPVNIPGGKMRIDLGEAVMQPEINQLPGSNKDYASVQRWIDISNQQYGLTVTTVESPLIEIGALVNEMPVNNGVKAWKKKTDISGTFYFYVMNNYWHTNYKAGQKGKVIFRYSLFPHTGFDKSFSDRKGIESCQPLLISPANNAGNGL